MLITRKAEFSASHVCANPRLSPEENERLYGKESRPHGHGHNYVLEVTLRGEVDPVHGMVLDLKALKDIIREEVLDVYDHRFLNREVRPFDEVVPTLENIARDIWGRLAGPIATTGSTLHSIRLHESDEMFVDYSERQAP
jgi:6-pyruvoyltetrahydropterin/6-carboxytetrahydropterin synthase